MKDHYPGSYRKRGPGLKQGINRNKVDLFHHQKWWGNAIINCKTNVRWCCHRGKKGHSYKDGAQHSIPLSPKQSWAARLNANKSAFMHKKIIQVQLRLLNWKSQKDYGWCGANFPHWCIWRWSGIFWNPHCVSLDGEVLRRSALYNCKEVHNIRALIKIKYG